MAKKFTAEEIQRLVNCFESLDVVPKMDTPEDLTDWMTDFIRGKQRLQEDYPETPISSGLKSQSKIPVTTHLLQTPKIMTFGGESDQKDSAFESWKYEILTLLREGSYSKCIINTAAKKSLRGDAAKVARRLGVDADVQQILEKFQIIYGRVEDPSDLLTEFHKATQAPNESVSSWCCRIEDLLFRAMEDDPSQMSHPEETIRLKFYSGLNQDIKDRIRHLKGKLHNLDSLLFEARRAEMEGKALEGDTSTKAAKVMMLTADDNADIVKLKGSICQLNTKVDKISTALEGLVNNTPSPAVNINRSRGRGRQYWNRSRPQHSGQQGYQDWNPHSWTDQSDNQGGNQGANQGANRGGNRGGSRGGNTYGNHGQHWNPHGNHNVPHAQPEQSGMTPDFNCRGARPKRPVICYRCNQEGHMAYGCRVDLSALSNSVPLNWEESV